MTDITWTNDTRRLADLVPWENNPKRMSKKQADGLLLSIERFGFAVPFLVSPDGDIYDGHQRQTLMGAIKDYGPDAVVDVRVSSRPLTDDERRELVVRLKQNQAGWDFDMLPNLYEREELLEWGFGPEELGMFPDDEPEGDDPGPQIDRAEELREKWGVETGQLWQLGEHRLICGDCTDAAVVARVMGGEKAEAVVTDPPYGMNYQSDAGGRVANDRLRDFRRLLEAMPSLLFATGASQIAVWTRWDIWREIHDAFERLYPPCGMIVWDKQNLSTGNTNHFGNSHELCYVSAPGDWVMKVDGKRPFSVIAYQVTSNHMDGEQRHHLTQKPLKLIEALVEMLSHDASIVSDFFLGSGTTIIACERLNRRCRAVEISPAYCGVAIERWATMTGREPVLLDVTG